MRVGYVFLVALAILVGRCDTSSTKAPQGRANFFRSIETEGRLLRDDEVAGDEERTRGAVASKIDELVDPATLDAAMKDITTMKALFRRWSADAAISEQVISRLSADALTFAKYKYLVLPYNGYREGARIAAQVDALVDPKTLNAALQDRRKMTDLFKQWNAEEVIAMRVVERLAGDPHTLKLYSPLIQWFNRYRFDGIEITP
ncbi:Avr1b-1 avirulence protein [Phytophthora nicotianae]|uniref:RxLR effector protein n=1 Tax=Phytophthora nicotianae TaxID=4792 RepID=A0A0W8D5T7_PHYNI|nr:Avr1b-1 avirulence protein [Phytophthora nicotianae]